MDRGDRENLSGVVWSKPKSAFYTVELADGRAKAIVIHLEDKPTPERVHHEAIRIGFPVTTTAIAEVAVCHGNFLVPPTVFRLLSGRHSTSKPARQQCAEEAPGRPRQQMRSAIDHAHGIPVIGYQRNLIH